MIKISNDNIIYLQKRINVTAEIQNTIIEHCEKYNINPDIIGYFSNWDEFLFYWCEKLDYTETELLQLYNRGDGEFLTIKSGEIIRFSI